MFWFFVLCLWSGQSDFMALFMVFNLWIGPHFIFEPCTLSNFDVLWSIPVCPQECSNSHIWILCDDHKMWGFSCMNWVSLVPWMFGSWRVNSIDILEAICVFWGFHSIVVWRIQCSGTWCQMDWEFFTYMLEELVCPSFRVVEEEYVSWRNCCIL